MIAAAWQYIQKVAPVICFHLDARQHVVEANSHAERLLGPHLVGRSLRELAVEFTPVPDLDAKEGADEKKCLLTLKSADGLPETFEFWFYKVEDGWVGMGHLDFEEQVRLRSEILALNRELSNITRQLHQANAELRELNQLKNQFLGMAAHDLRKPIGVIMTYTEFVLDESDAALSAEHRRFLQTCLGAAAGMKRLIDDFLDVAVIESGKLKLNRTRLILGEVLDGAVEMGKLLAGRKRIQLIVESPDPNTPIFVDGPKLQQVLVNLIANAVEHSQPGKRVWLLLHFDDSELIIRVRDEGPGIAPQDQARLFQPFTHAGTRKTAGERSVGLGLAITRQVVQAHHGRVWVESVPGEGATFCVALSVEPSHDNQSTQEQH